LIVFLLFLVRVALLFGFGFGFGNFHYVVDHLSGKIADVDVVVVDFVDCISVGGGVAPIVVLKDQKMEQWRQYLQRKQL